MLENSELKKSLDCVHKDRMEEQGKMRGEIAEYQLRLQEAENKHQALLLDTNKQVKMRGLVTGQAEECVGGGDEALFARKPVLCIIVMLHNFVNGLILLTSLSFPQLFARVLFYALLHFHPGESSKNHGLWNSSFIFCLFPL